MAKRGPHSTLGWTIWVAGLLGLLGLLGIGGLVARPAPPEQAALPVASPAASATAPRSPTRPPAAAPSATPLSITAPAELVPAPLASPSPAAPAAPPVTMRPVGRGLTATAIPTLPPVNYDHPILGYAFAENSLWIVLNDALLRTTDDGQHWVQQSPRVGAAGAALAFVDATHGWLVTSGRLQATTDGGQHWVQQIAADGGLSFISPWQGWALAGRDLLVTSDGGLTWHSAGNNRPLRQVQFFDALHGWSFLNDAVPDPDFYYTQDGGKTWLSRALPHCRWYKIRGWFVASGPHTGWVACGPDIGSQNNSFSLNETTDGGQTWQGLPPPDAGLSDMEHGDHVGAPFFLDDQHGWITIEGAVTLLRATADGGHSWTNRAILRGGLYDLRFASRTQGYAISGSALLGTRDGGATWTPIYYTPPPPGPP